MSLILTEPFALMITAAKSQARYTAYLRSAYVPSSGIPLAKLCCMCQRSKSLRRTHCPHQGKGRREESEYCCSYQIYLSSPSPHYLFLHCPIYIYVCTYLKQMCIYMCVYVCIYTIYVYAYYIYVIAYILCV